MSTDAVAILGFVSLFVLMLLRVPIGMALGLVGVTGFGYLTSMGPALKIVGHTTMRTVTDFNYAVVPLFLLMGSFATTSGMSRELFRAANAFIGHLRGGLGIATILACGGFAAICGSSVATAATFSRVAYPEMRRFNYPESFSAGVIAAGGTLGIMIPPSIGFVIFGIFAEVSISKLLIAGILPGLLTAAVYSMMIIIRCSLNPALAPPIDEGSTLSERMRALADIWPLLALILGVIGGIYGGLTTPTEAGAFGAMLALVIAVAQGKMSWARLRDSITEAVETTARIFFIVIGAVLFSRLLAFAGTAPYLTDLVKDYITDPLPLILAAAVLFVILGMFLDALGLMLLTLPVLLPLFTAANLDLIWFGVLTIKFVEIGLITPPVGMNVYVIKSVAGPSISLETVFKGVFWFIGCEVIITTMLIAFPEISLFLPNLMG